VLLSTRIAFRADARQSYFYTQLLSGKQTNKPGCFLYAPSPVGWIESYRLGRIGRRLVHLVCRCRGARADLPDVPRVRAEARLEATIKLPISAHIVPPGAPIVKPDGTIGPGHRRSAKPVIDILAPMRQGASFNAKVLAGEASQR
jgi:hypothetical protein